MVLFFVFFPLPRVNVDSVQSEANALLKRLKETKTKVSNSTEEVKGQYCKVLEVSDKTPTVMSSDAVVFVAVIEILHILILLLLQENLEACQALCQRLATMEKKRSELALYLCEDANQLSLEELFGTIKTFRGLFVKALKVWCNIPSLHSLIDACSPAGEREMVLFSLSLCCGRCSTFVPERLARQIAVYFVFLPRVSDILTFMLLGKQNPERAGGQGREEKEAACRRRIQEAERGEWQNKCV